MNYEQQMALGYEALRQQAMGLDPQQAQAAPVEQPQAQPEAAAAAPEAVAAQAAQAAHEAAETPREERMEQQAREEAAQQTAADQAATEAERQRQENLNEALRQERERRRQEAERAQRAEAERQRLEAEHKALLDALKDPERVKAHLAEIAPGPAPDFDDDPDAAIDHRLTPAMQRIERLEAELARRDAEAAQRAMLDELARKHGHESIGLLQQFDAANPHLAELHPEVRILAARGLMAGQMQKPDPAAEEARIKALAEAQAKTLAEQQLAAVLASGQAPKGIATLGSAPQARQEHAAPDLNTLGHGDLVGKSQAELQNLLRGVYGGG